MRPLTLAWFFGMCALAVAVVHQDPIPGADQDWLIRPLYRADLAAAKLGFVVVAVCLPLFVLDLAHATALGFSLPAAIPVMAGKELYLFAFLLVPVMALASVTRNAPELALLGAALIVVYAACTALAAWLLGEYRCPTCDSGFAWLNHAAQHLATCGGAVLILGLQYRRRLTSLSRVLALAGAAALVCVQVPWDTAFAMHARFDGTPGAGGAILLAPAVDEGVSAATLTAAPHEGAAARQAARALVHGDVDEAVELMRRRVMRDPAKPAELDVPIRVSGIAAREFLLVDRAEITLVRADGRTAYRGTIPDESPMALRREAEGTGAEGTAFVAHQIVHVPSDRRAGASGPPASLRLEYFLTLMRQDAEYALPAVDGSLHQPATGVCATRLDSESVTLRCKQLGRAPFCLSATLVAADGARNPSIVKCLPDYRPYGATFSALTFLGADLPVHDRYGLAQYPVDAAKAAQAHVVLRVYEVAAHLRRGLTAAEALPTPR